MTYVVPDAVREPLYAIVPYFNPWRWKSREKHTLRALKHFHDAGAVIVLVEVAYNRREFTFKNQPRLNPRGSDKEVSEYAAAVVPSLFGLEECGIDGTLANCGIQGSGYRHRYVPLRTRDELWLKENAINAGVSHLPHDWQQVCWLDSDIHFVRPNWVGECIHKLQHYSFLQMFSHARDVGPNYEMLPADYPHADGAGFIYAWQTTGLTKESRQVDGDPDSYYGGRVWPGLAWACTRKAWDDVGGLLDFAIWGGGDWHMAHALVEKTDGMMRNDLHRNYRKLVNQWYYRCHTHIRRNVGVMEGSVLHNWHGRKTERGYNAKHALLAKVGFDPLRHLKRDYQGIYQLHDDRSTAFVQLRDLMRRIARERNEDSIDL